MGPSLQKEEGMNWKRFLWASLAVFAVGQGLGYIIDTLILKKTYESLISVWRPDMASKIWVAYVMGLLYAVMFTFVFIKGREGKGIQEGVRFGIIMWLLVLVPWYHFLWVTFPIPYVLTFKWTLYGLLAALVEGILAAVIYKPVAPVKA